LTVFKQLLAVVWTERFMSVARASKYVRHSQMLCVSVASVWHPFFFFLFFSFCKHFPSQSPCDFPLSPPGWKEEGGVIQPGSPEHPFWSCSEEHGLGNLCSAESRLQREADRGRGYTGERGCNGEWRREGENERKKRGRGYERRARTEPRQRMIRPGGFRCCFGVRLGMGSCFCHSRREGERRTHLRGRKNSVVLWTPEMRRQGPSAFVFFFCRM